VAELVVAPGCVCDTCGKPYVPGDAIYSIADRWDDDGRLSSFRHWECNETNGPLVKLRESLSRLDSLSDQVKDALSRLQRTGNPTPGGAAGPPRSTGTPSRSGYSGPRHKP